MSIFNVIKAQVPILEVVGSYTNLKKAGHYYKGVCPFHSERTASFTVSPDKNIFYCFGCHVTGDVISFIEKVENCSPVEAVRMLAERYGVEVPRESIIQYDTQKEEKKRTYFHLCESVARWCHNQLFRSSQPLRYLQERNISQASINLFMIGYFPAHGASGLIEALRSEGFIAQDLLDAKIIFEQNRSFYTPFEDRILFPIFDHLGRCCGFGGRVFQKHDTRSKYYNSHENEFFNKGSLLYGFDNAKKAAARLSSLFLVEGYVDCIAMVQAGRAHTVATLGTACSIEHLKLISRYVNKLYVLFDGDQAGRNAIARLTELCWEVDIDLMVVSLPTGFDPDSFLSSGKDLDEYVARAEDIFMFFIRILGGDYKQKGLQERLEATRKFIKTIARISDHLKKEMLLQKASAAFDIPVASLKQEMSLIQGHQKQLKESRGIHEQVSDSLIFPELSVLEKKLFSGIVNYSMYVSREDEVYLVRYLPVQLQNVVHKIFAVKDRESLTFEYIYEMLEVEERPWVSRMVLEFPCEDHDTLQTLIQQFIRRQWKIMVGQVATKLKFAQQAENAVEVAQLLTEFQELKARLLSRGLI